MRGKAAGNRMSIDITDLLGLPRGYKFMPVKTACGEKSPQEFEFFVCFFWGGKLLKPDKIWEFLFSRSSMLHWHEK